MTRNKIIFFIIASFFVAGLFLDSPLFCQADQEEEITLVQGEFMGFKVDNPKRVSIDDPRIVDIRNTTPTELFIEAKSAGKTIMRLWEPAGQRSVTFRVLRENLDELRSRVEKMIYNLGIENIYLTIDNEAQKVVINGQIEPSEEENYKKIKEQFSSKIADLVVVGPEKGLIEIEAQILELNKDAQKQLGLSWTNSLSFAENGSGIDTS